MKKYFIFILLLSMLFFFQAYSALGDDVNYYGYNIPEECYLERTTISDYVCQSDYDCPSTRCSNEQQCNTDFYMYNPPNNYYGCAQGTSCVICYPCKHTFYCNTSIGRCMRRNLNGLKFDSSTKKYVNYLYACSGSRPYCFYDGLTSCRACLENAHCPSDKPICRTSDGVCIQCITKNDCPVIKQCSPLEEGISKKVLNDTAECIDNICRYSHTDCASESKVCDPISLICAYPGVDVCFNDFQCNGGVCRYCNLSTHRCQNIREGVQDTTNPGLCSSSITYDSCSDKCRKSGYKKACDGQGNCNERYSVTGDVSNGKVCSNGQEVDATTSTLSCTNTGICTRTSNNCSATIKYAECAFGYCDTSYGFHQLINVVAQQFKYLDSNCNQVLGPCDYSAWNGCSSTNNRLKTRRKIYCDGNGNCNHIPDNPQYDADPSPSSTPYCYATNGVVNGYQCA